jgi:hypothetical protein
MKRFTETQKWEDPWFRRLAPEMKLLWQWILDRCDNAGVIDPDIDLASFQIGYSYPMDTLLEFGERVVKLPCGKWFIPKFIEFQYGALSRDCKAHNPIFLSLKKHGLEGYPKGIHTLQEKEEDKDKEKEQEKEKERAAEKSKSKGSIEDMKSFALEIGLAESDGENCFCKWESTGWKDIKDWRMKMRTWKHEGFHASQKTGSNKTHRKNEYPQETLELPD